jgi:hypothetical protein
MKKVFFVLLWVFFVSPAPGFGAAVSAGCLKEVCFEAAFDVAGEKIPLKGVALHEWAKLDLYVGALYLPETVTTPEAALGNIPKALVLDYQKKVSPSWMNRAARHQIKKSPHYDERVLGERIEVIARAYQKVRKGDRYALVYEPGTGTTLLRNGEKVTVIPGEDFQRVYFGIWLSDQGLNQAFRNKLFQKSGETT